MRNLISVILVIFFSTQAFAEKVSVAVNPQQKQIATPSNGQSMHTIEQNFGQPIERAPAVGEPPITRWRYAEFTVYFEHDKVIHAVIHRS